jgi:hypothetical protein
LQDLHRHGDLLDQRLAAFAPCSEQVEIYIGMKLGFIDPLARGRETPQKPWRILDALADAVGTMERMEANRG